MERGHHALEDVRRNCNDSARKPRPQERARIAPVKDAMPDVLYAVVLFRKTRSHSDNSSGRSPVGEFCQGFSGHAKRRPLIHWNCSNALVERDCELVPVKNIPFESSAASLSGEPGK